MVAFNNQKETITNRVFKVHIKANDPKNIIFHSTEMVLTPSNVSGLDLSYYCSYYQSNTFHMLLLGITAVNNNVSSHLLSCGIDEEVNPKCQVDDNKCQRKQNSTAAVNPLHIYVLISKCLYFLPQRRHLSLQVFCLDITAFSITYVPSITLERQNVMKQNENINKQQANNQTNERPQQKCIKAK